MVSSELWCNLFEKRSSLAFHFINYCNTAVCYLPVFFFFPHIVPDCDVWVITSSCTYRACTIQYLRVVKCVWIVTCLGTTAFHIWAVLRFIFSCIICTCLKILVFFPVRRRKFSFLILLYILFAEPILYLEFVDFTDYYYYCCLYWYVRSQLPSWSVSKGWLIGDDWLSNDVQRRRNAVSKCF